MPNRIQDMIECNMYSDIVCPAVCCITVALNMDKEGCPSIAEGIRVTDYLLTVARKLNYTHRSKIS